MRDQVLGSVLYRNGSTSLENGIDEEESTLKLYIAQIALHIFFANTGSTEKFSEVYLRD